MVIAHGNLKASSCFALLPASVAKHGWTTMKNTRIPKELFAEQWKLSPSNVSLLPRPADENAPVLQPLLEILIRMTVYCRQNPAGAFPLAVLIAIIFLKKVSSIINRKRSQPSQELANYRSS